VKRIGLLMVVGALLLTMIPGVASADTFRCPFFADFCFGTENRDTIYERIGNGVEDNIFGLRGGDVILADDFTSDRDELDGGRGNDRLNTNDNDQQDLINCGRGNNDVAILDNRDNVNHRNCEDIRRR
jgi:Ca2+-binding RTX toxin-like protein